jgi:hypothetical protein
MVATGCSQDTTRPLKGLIIMPKDNEQKEDLLLNIWQAITLVGQVRDRFDEIEPSELEIVLDEAESLLIGAVTEAAQRPNGPIRRRRGLKFWKATWEAPSAQATSGGSTSVVPFPGIVQGKALAHLRSRERAALRTGEMQGTNPLSVQFSQLNRGSIPAAPVPPWFSGRVIPFGWKLRLSFLVLIAVLPIIAAQIWHQRELQSERQEVVRERVLYRVLQLAAEIGELREGARQLLLAIAQLEPVKLHQTEACSTLLAKLRSSYPNYGLLGAADSQGRIFCASGPTTASVAGQAFFTRALAHDGMVVGSYWIDPVSGEKIINFAQQFSDNNGQLLGVTFASLDLVWLSEHLKEGGFSPTTSKLIADRDGNIIARLPGPEEFVGQNIRGSHERIMDGGEAGWEEVTGVDGVTRIFGYVPPSLPPKDFFLSIGESKAETFAAINRAAWRDAASFLAGLVGSICVAWAGRRLVLGPGQGMAGGTSRLTAEHTQLTHPHSGRLADGFALTVTSLRQGLWLVVRRARLPHP